jgi:hypothetical protein
MTRTILLSLLFAVVLPTLFNLINSKSSKEKFKFDSAYILKTTLTFVALTAVFVLIDYL